MAPKLRQTSPYTSIASIARKALASAARVRGVAEVADGAWGEAPRDRAKRTVSTSSRRAARCMRVSPDALEASAPSGRCAAWRAERRSGGSCVREQDIASEAVDVIREQAQDMVGNGEVSKREF